MSKYLISLVFILAIMATKGQAQEAEIRLSNVSIVSSTTLQFDVDIRARTGTIYLGNSDIKFKYEPSRFGVPVFSRVSSTSTLRNTVDANIAYSIGTFIESPTVTVNINTPAPTDPTDFEERVARITQSFQRIATFRMANFTGATTAEAGLDCQPVGTIIATIAPPPANFMETGINSACLIVLPLSLLKFTAQATKQTAFLNWQTADEKAVSHFDIEKSSDAKDWVKMGAVKAKNTAHTEGYSFRDDKAFEAANSVFYRLKMVDMDGSFSYSPIRQITNETTARLKIYPNPAKVSLTVQGITAEETWQIIDEAGKIMATFKGEKVVNLSLYTEGVYFIRTSKGAVQAFVVGH